MPSGIEGKTQHFAEATGTWQQQRTRHADERATAPVKTDQLVNFCIANFLPSGYCRSM